MTVLAVALVSGALVVNDVHFTELFDTTGVDTLFNPFVYTVNALFHADWAHYRGNMLFWVPFGTVLTWLTSDRHLLGLVVTAHVLSGFVEIAVGQLGVGLSGAVFAVVAATLVRATGMAMRDASSESLQATVTGLLAPILGGFFLVVVLAGAGSPVAHFSHFLGFLYGGAIEAMYVFADHGDDDGGRTIPRRVGR